MSAPLTSSQWFRVADLKPSVASDATLARQVARGRTWHVLGDSASGRQVRLNAAAWAFAGRCDGDRSVDHIWHDLLDLLGEEAPTQDDVLRLLSQLHAAGVLRFDAAPNLDALFEARTRRARRDDRARINPLALRARLLDPSAILDRMWPFARHAFGLPAFLAWALLVLPTMLVCAAHAGELALAVRQLQGSPRSMVLLWFVYPLVKTLHETAHALMVRKFGGAVRNAGITLMFFTPAPWVDASAASAFASRRQRMAVSAAGIMAELLLAAVAMLAWLAVEPGLVRDAALATLFVCGVSTLAVNANPLMRFDGYYVFIDALDLPNLAARSQAWWASVAARALHGRDAPVAPALPPGEGKWLALYAPASLIYRIGLLAALILWVGSHSWLVGLLLAPVFILWLATGPVRALAGLWKIAPTPAARTRTALGTLAISVCLAAGLFALPLPDRVVAQGVVWPPEDAQVRAESAGFVQEVATRHGEIVEPGRMLVVLAEDALVAEHDRLASELAGHQARQYTALLRDPARAADATLDIERSQAALARAEEKLAQLEVRSRRHGQLVLPRDADLPGSYAARGAMLGYVLSPGPANVRAALEEDEALRVRRGVRAVEVVLAGYEGAPLIARVARDMPAASHDLPSAALGERGGGPFAVDGADRDGKRISAPVFLLDVAVPALDQERMGTRAWVRFDLGYETLGVRAARRARQLLLRHFSPAGQA